jgi:putative holliday junction resolvase
MASPLTVIERSNETADVEKIVSLINQHQVKEVIIGLPLSLSGNAGGQAEKVHVFIDHLTQHTGIPLKLRDERLSTVSAQRFMREGRTKKTREKIHDDAFAAAVILQGYLEEGR